jgi:hypothetical protein
MTSKPANDFMRTLIPTSAATLQPQPKVKVD